MRIEDCSFLENLAPLGGAIAKYGDLRQGGNFDSVSIEDIARCSFVGNSASRCGGAIYDSTSSKIRIYNSLFAGNTAPKGAVWYSPPRDTVAHVSTQPHTLYHCTIAHNKSSSTDTTDYPVTLNGRDTIRNCIFWGNVSGSGRQIPRPTGPVLITDNLIQPGSGPSPGFPRTYTFNPWFEAPGTAAAAPFPLNNTYDYRLKAYSAAIDTASNLGSLQGYNTHDLDSNLRVFGARPDLGAYERIYCTAPPITLNPNPVTVCGSDSVLLAARSSIGGPFYWNGADTAFDSIWVKEPANTTYHVIYAGLTGNDKIACRSKNSVAINVYPKPYAVIILQDSTLSVPPLFGGYQWYRNDTLIPGATGPSLLARSNGRYRVMITGFGNTCTDSAVYLLANLNVGEQTFAGSLQIMPNPTRDGLFHVSLELKKPMQEVRISVTDITGRALWQHHYTKPGSSFFAAVNLGAAAKGMYFVRITADGEAFTRRLSVE